MQVSGGEWQGKTGESWAQHWRRTDRSFTVLTQRLLHRAADLPFDQAIDIGCGAGELALAIARSRPVAQVVGVDISPALIAVARRRGADLPNVSFAIQDAAIWRPSAIRPDLVLSRHGVMFFADSVAAFANIADGAADGARLVFSCFRDISLNPFMTEVSQLLPEAEQDRQPSAAQPAPGPFAFADRQRVESILDRAGWADIAFEPVDFQMIAGAGDDPVAEAVAYFQSIGPAARAAAQLPDAQRAGFDAALHDLARTGLRDGVVSLAAAAWIVTARKA